MSRLPGVTSENPSERTGFPGSPALDEIVDETGVAWATFRADLTPRYATAWRHMLTYLLLSAGVLLLHAIVAGRLGNLAGLAIAPLAALPIGFFLASMMCFMHEAAHYNIHPDKVRNDKWANLLLCPLVGEEIGHYRRLHWQHHLHLGSTGDTEISYYNAPTPLFLLRALTGLHALHVSRDKRDQSGSTAPLAWEPGKRTVAMRRALLLHGAALTIPILSGLYSTALVWAFAAFGVYPFFGTLRQLLEHRSETARADVDYRDVDHGPVNRMFGGSLFARTLGAAGFNRHLLHHWYPQASYTCFDDLEAFFLRTDLREIVDAARTTYGATLQRLMHPLAAKAPH